MNRPQDVCNVCGCTEKRLYDGFYYCTECGTQDVKLQETIVESVCRDGVFGIGSKKKIQDKAKASEITMPDSWYKWHGFNFVLFGVADELIQLGAKPSFKTKLLWVWTRYMKAYMNREEFGLKDTTKEDQNDKQPEEEIEKENSDSDESVKKVYILDSYHRARTKETQKLNFKLVVTLINIALNLDESPIQSVHLMRYIKEFRLSIPYNLKNLIPKEMKPELLQKIGSFSFRLCCAPRRVDFISMTLLKNLRLGTPLVPDLRLIIEDYLDELCLPYSLKPMIFSLMEFCRCDSIDILINDNYIGKVPNYHADCVVFILMTLKLLFGLDDDYDIRLSEAVEKINNREKRHKVYTDGLSETKRLFSINEWCNFIQIRQLMLQENCLLLGHKNGLDMNIYVAMEQTLRDQQSKKDLKDEITDNIVNSIPGGELPHGVIPNSEFKATRTPYFTYTKVLVDHLKDPDIKQTLSEDFRQYSVDYVTSDLYLVNPDSENKENLIVGVDKDSKTIKGYCLSEGFKQIKKIYSRQVYMRNCDNHNWMSTKAPTGEHIIKITPLYPDLDNIVYDEPEPKRRKIKKQNEVDYYVVEVADDETIDTSEIENDVERRLLIESILAQGDGDGEQVKENIETETIEEEDPAVNIFDDDFIEETVKDEIGVDVDSYPMDNNADVNTTYNETFNDTQKYNCDKNKDSDASSVDSIKLNLNGFDRRQLIKELIIMKCRKHKIVIPIEYRDKFVSKKNRKFNSCKDTKYTKKTYALKMPIISSYYEHIKQDALLQIGNKVKLAIEKANKAEEFDQLFNNNEVQDSVNNDAPQDLEPSNTEFNETLKNTLNKMDDDSDSERERLFSESSDEETYGKQFLPEIDPDYDEKTHDISQLYLKVTKPDEPEMELDEELSYIVKRKIKNDIKNPSLLQWKKERRYSRSDSEEDLPLADIKRLMDHMKSYNNPKCQPPQFEKFLNKDVPVFNYWSKIYFLLIFQEIPDDKFDHFLKDMPKRFQFVLRQFATISGIKVASLYKRLQNLELIMFEKCGHDVQRHEIKKGWSKYFQRRLYYLWQ